MVNHPDATLDITQFLQRFSSKVLWHFTGRNKGLPEALKNLEAIIDSGEIKATHQCQVSMPSGKLRPGGLAACMCDIPFRDLRIHVLRYREVGIACWKPHAVEHGFNPVFYVHRTHPLLEHAEKLLTRSDALAEPYKELVECLDEYNTLVGTFVKVSDLQSSPTWDDPSADETGRNNFYYEREWRSPYTWKLQQGDVAALMIPESHVGTFEKQFANHDNKWMLDATILRPELIEAL